MSSSTEVTVKNTQVWHLNADDQRRKAEDLSGLPVEDQTRKAEDFRGPAADDQERKKKNGSYNVSSTWNEIRENVYNQDNTPENEKCNQENQTNTKNKNKDVKINSMPTMVLSVIGDSGSFVPRPWPTTIFQTALIEAAKSGGETWILYRGREEGVSKVVEEAYHHYENIEFWKTEVEINNPKRHIKLIDISGGKVDQASKLGATQTPKEENVLRKYKTEKGEYDSLELEFETFVSEQELFLFGSPINFKILVPVAIIVCEGDLKTIAKISNALQRNLPVIIMKGSGKAADLTLDYLENPKVLWKKVSILLGIELDGEKYSEVKKCLKKINEHKKLISVFDLDRDNPLLLSNIVGDALIRCMSIRKQIEESRNGTVDNDPTSEESVKSGKGCPESKNKPKLRDSNLSIRCNALVADGLPADLIINEQNIEGFKWVPITYVLRANYCTATSLPLHFYFGYQILQVNKLVETLGHVLLFEALKANRCDYVKVLIDRGVMFKIDNLNDLYIQTVLCTEYCVKESDCSHIKWDLKKIPQAKVLYTNLRKLAYQETEINPKKGKTDDKPDLMTKASKKMCREILRYDEFRTEPPVDDDSIADVLLWALFVNRKDLAEICWLRGKDHLLTGLICSAILKELSKDASDVKEHVISKDLEEHSKMFEQRCIRLMDKMYEENEELAIDLMETEANIWGIHSSPLPFAYENFMYDIIAHTCSQKYMNNDWWNNLEPEPFLKSAVNNRKNFLTFIKAPRTKYVINYFMFLSVLIAYSYFVLTSVGTKYHTLTPKVLEIYVYIWSGGDGLEEIVACFGCKRKKGGSHRGILSRIHRHLYDFWNVVDLLSYLLIIAALFVRHFYPDETHVLARNLFAFSLLVMYLRFLEAFLIQRIVGPTLMMIKEMLKDLLIFLLIAVFVILGVGIYYHANLWPDHRKMMNGGFSNWAIWKIIYYPYWQLYGEFNLDVLDGSDVSDCNVTSIWEADMSMNRCPQEDWTVTIIAAIFVLFSNLLLVNLVIAMFSYTFERVKNISEKLWHFQRYTVITDYIPRIPSPFNCILRPIIFIWSLKPCCKHPCSCKVYPKEDEERKKRKQEALSSLQKMVALRYCNQKEGHLH